MVQGESVKPEERQFIHAKKAVMFPSQIAKELSTNPNFTILNGGFRGERTVKRIIQESD